MPRPIPLTVIGGYLGAGKTTLINHLLRTAADRRIGIIVNDFGSLAIDADLLVGAGRDGGVIGLTNGCVCCTIGAGLHEALTTLTTRPRPPEHVVIEASGVADPATAAAWGTVAPFEPGGVIVLADATSVIGLSRDRYVGSDVRRQLAGADIVLVTKTDVCEPGEIADVDRWLGAATGGAPSLDVVDGVVPADVVLGLRPDAVTSVADREDHADRYATWAWTSSDAIPLEAIRSMVASLPDHVLRVKGVVRLDDGSAAVVQVVGRRVDIDETVIVPDRSQLVAIGLRTDPPSPTPFGRH